MPMIWLDLKEAGEFQFSPSVRQVSWVWSEATGLRAKVRKTGIKEHTHISVSKLLSRAFTLKVSRHYPSAIAEFSRRKGR